MKRIGYAILWLLEAAWIALSRLFRRRALVAPHWPGERPAPPEDLFPLPADFWERVDAEPDE
jgi:hypothetical protein